MVVVVVQHGPPAVGYLLRVNAGRPTRTASASCRERNNHPVPHSGLLRATKPLFLLTHCCGSDWEVAHGERKMWKGEWWGNQWSDGPLSSWRPLWLQVSALRPARPFSRRLDNGNGPKWYIGTFLSFQKISFCLTHYHMNIKCTWSSWVQWAGVLQSKRESFLLCRILLLHQAGHQDNSSPPSTRPRVSSLADSILPRTFS